MTTILGFDCAGTGCSAAVLTAGRVVACRATEMERGQAAMLLPMIGEVLAEAGLAVAALDLIAVTVGPGAFTGLRIGIAAARGLALAGAVPAIGVSSFAAVAAAVSPEERRGRTLVVALESKRAEFFLQAIAPDAGAGALVASGELAAWLPAGPLVVVGDAAARLVADPAVAPARGRITLSSASGVPDPGDVARLAAALWRPGEATPLPRPLYLRAPDTSRPRAAAPAAGLLDRLGLDRRGAATARTRRAMNNRPS